jgi:CspA family cold shock protein
MEPKTIFCFMQMFFEISGKVRWQIMRGSNLLPKGLQATVVLSIAPPETTSASRADLENVDDAKVAQLPLEAARVKWFDKAKGFGFANIWGSSEDVFVHVEISRRSGLADLQAGEAVAICVISGKRGKMAAEVCSWESVSRD